MVLKELILTDLLWNIVLIFNISNLEGYGDLVRTGF